METSQEAQAENDKNGKCGHHRRCCCCKTIIAIFLLIVAGLIGFLFGRCCGRGAGYCPPSGMMPMMNCPMGGTPQQPAPQK